MSNYRILANVYTDEIVIGVFAVGHGKEIYKK
ncbi:type II toxin-antitoxin system RelE family toxin [Streptococcus tangpeifui]